MRKQQKAFTRKNLKWGKTLNKPRIVIVDYGAGNIKSIERAFHRLGFSDTKLAKDVRTLRHAQAVVLPGVGAFENCMANLKKSGLIPTLEEIVFKNSIPILGICVGMQLFSSSSEENGHHEGLSWIPGEVVRITPPSGFTIPHVGWNQLSINYKSKMFQKMKSETNVYFDHSYAVKCMSTYVSSTTNHGVEIVAAVEKENIFGVQFHPEKSGVNGLKILRAFANLI